MDNDPIVEVIAEAAADLFVFGELSDTTITKAAIRDIDLDEVIAFVDILEEEIDTRLELEDDSSQELSVFDMTFCGK